MKHLIKILMVSAACLMAAGCSGNDNDETTVAPIRIIESDKTYQYQGDSGTITFEADGPVSVSTDQTWCNATLSGNKVTVTVDANRYVSTRSANVVFTSGDYTTKVNIIQLGIVYAFNYDIPVFGFEAGERQTLVLEDAHYELEVTGTSSSWLTAYPEGNSLVITTIESNFNLSDRKGVIYLKMEGIEMAVDVIQGKLIPSYDFMLGEWKMTAVNQAMLAINERTLTFSVREQGKSYTVKGIRTDYPDFEYVFEWNDGGTLSLPLPSKAPIGPSGANFAYIGCAAVGYPNDTGAYSVWGQSNNTSASSFNNPEREFPLTGSIKENSTTLYIDLTNAEYKPSSTIPIVAVGIIFRTASSNTGWTAANYVGSFGSTSSAIITDPYFMGNIKLSKNK